MSKLKCKVSTGGRDVMVRLRDRCRDLLVMNFGQGARDGVSDP
ncbi:MAG: hypothetical protein AB1665_04860 [Candidatus Thermoplasmatota archaeon]